MNPEAANTISAVSAALSCCIAGFQTLLAIGALVYAARQIRDARQEQLLSAVWEIFKELDSSQTRDARKFVYRNRELYKSLEGGNDEKLKELSKEAHENAQRVSNSFDRVGYVVSQGLIPAKLILDGYYDIAARCWLILRPYIEATRNFSKQKDFQRYFQALGEMALSKYITPEEASQQVYTPFDES